MQTKARQRIASREGVGEKVEVEGEAAPLAEDIVKQGARAAIEKRKQLGHVARLVSPRLPQFLRHSGINFKIR